MSRRKDKNVSSKSQKNINRRTVRRVVRGQHITGATLQRCAIDIAAALELHPTCTRKVEERLTALIRDGEVILDDAMLRMTSDKERRAARQNKGRSHRNNRMQKRMGSKQLGGVRSLPLRTTRPFPVSLMS